MAVLSALEYDPKAVTTHIEAVSTYVGDEYAPLRQYAISILDEQQHLPQNTLDYIAIRLYNPKEGRIIRNRILRILTENSYWIQFLRSRSTKIQEQTGEFQQLVDIGLALVKHQGLETAIIAVFSTWLLLPNLKPDCYQPGCSMYFP
jgi:hypothetical protein